MKLRDITIGSGMTRASPLRTRTRSRRPLEAEMVIDRCRGKIALRKAPTMVRIVDEFPMTVTGKVQKFATRDAEIQTL